MYEVAGSQKKLTLAQPGPDREADAAVKWLLAE
jgi:hypothetical protein